MPILRTISGGQTGVDRAALDVALELGIPCGGWCPEGRVAEDGRIPDRYPLIETRSADLRVRTRKNVEDSDATLVLTTGLPSSGTALTISLAQESAKPCLVVDLSQPGPGSKLVADWIATNGVAVVNVAGPRESESPGIYDLAADFLRETLSWPTSQKM